MVLVRRKRKWKTEATSEAARDSGGISMARRRKPMRTTR